MNNKGSPNVAEEYIDFVRHRITQLREKMSVSEYKMSGDLGHSYSYINGISSGNSLPSFSEFFYICDYLGISPKDFFDTESKEPQLVRVLCNEVINMSDDDLKLLISIAKRMNEG